ncbi:predicted dithiol-disulfide oxidoreductase [Bacillus oleivorans]|uniref:Predicted dithiol-disulfide oxidoreductase n=1 Tax=Bacillus oleivorans TaxID=1448271 RepID=A0A285D3Y6_9BACI|nr:DUF899 family protein [Bacillus oleivorans]SNX74026.1 predicted dithiol-disulfide oxidoreductase [Bacillus oleivorans]
MNTVDLEQQIEQLEAEIHEKKIKLAQMRKAKAERPVQNYAFLNPDGDTVYLSDLFCDKNELIVIHNMGKACSYCTMWADGFSSLYHHIARKAAFVLESPDEPSVLGDFAAERRWTFPVVSSHSQTFKEDVGFAKGKQYMPGVSVFRRDQEGRIFQGATAPFGPGDDYCIVWPLFDLLPSGYEDYRPTKDLNDRAPFRLTHNIAVQVQDYEKALAFYQNIIGMAQDRVIANESRLSLGGTNFYIEKAAEQVEPGQVFFELSVSDYQEAKMKLIEAGCKITKVFHEKSEMFQDPYGLKFHLFQGTK